MKPISVTAFLFTLEEILLETIPIKDIRSLRYKQVEYFFTYVEKLYPAREITQKKFANFKKNYHSRKEVWAKDHFPEEIKQALRRARDQMAEAFPSSSDRVSGCDAPSLGQLYEIQKQIDLLWDEIAILKNSIAKSGPETGTSCDPTRTVYRPPNPKGAAGCAAPFGSAAGRLQSGTTKCTLKTSLCQSTSDSGAFSIIYLLPQNLQATPYGGPPPQNTTAISAFG